MRWLLLFIPVLAFASGTDVEVDASSTMTNKGGTAIGVGGADYDITADCMYHVGGLTVAVGRRNEWCEGMTMIGRGMVSAGKRHICMNSHLKDNYDNYQSCYDDMVITKPAIIVPDEIVEAHDEELEVYEQRLEQIEQQIAKPAPRPQVIERTVVDDGAERRANARKSLAEFQK